MGHIFISYSHKDTDYAHRLASSLQRRGFEVWIDARLDYGSQWPQELQKQLDGCEAFILIMTPRSFASEWVQSELQRAKRKLKPVFPLLLEGDEPWLSVESTQFYDVRGGKLPDERLYSTLGRVVTISQTASTPEGSKGSTGAKSEASLSTPKFGPGTAIAMIGTAAVVLVALAAAVLARFNSSFLNPSPGASTGPAVTLSASRTSESAITSEPTAPQTPSLTPADFQQNEYDQVFATTSALDQVASVLYGPASGHLTSEDDGSLECQFLDVFVTNAIIKVKFSYPYKYETWTFGLQFRDVGKNQEYRLKVVQDGAWEARWHRLNAADEGVASTINGGQLSNLLTGENASNEIKLYINDESAFFYLDDKYVSEIDVSGAKSPGDIGVCIDFDDAPNGQIIDYSDFTVWSLP